MMILFSLERLFAKTLLRTEMRYLTFCLIIIFSVQQSMAADDYGKCRLSDRAEKVLSNDKASIFYPQVPYAIDAKREQDSGQCHLGKAYSKQENKVFRVRETSSGEIVFQDASKYQRTKELRGVAGDQKYFSLFTCKPGIKDIFIFSDEVSFFNQNNPEFRFLIGLIRSEIKDKCYYSSSYKNIALKLFLHQGEKLEKVLMAVDWPGAKETYNYDLALYKNSELLKKAYNGEPKAQYELAQKYLKHYKNSESPARFAIEDFKSYLKSTPYFHYVPTFTDKQKKRTEARYYASTGAYFEQKYYHWLGQAAQNGLTRARYQLAEKLFEHFQEHIFEKEKDSHDHDATNLKPHHIRMLMEPLAKEGYKKASYYLGALYKYGALNVGKDEEKAFYYIQEAASQQIPEGYYELAKMYHHERHDIEKAINLYKKSNTPQAHKVLGETYESGILGAPDYHKALTHYLEMEPASAIELVSGIVNHIDAKELNYKNNQIQSMAKYAEKSQSGDTKLNMAKILDKSGDLNRAADLYAEAKLAEAAKTEPSTDFEAAFGTHYTDYIANNDVSYIYRKIERNLEAIEDIEFDPWLANEAMHDRRDVFYTLVEPYYSYNRTRELIVAMAMAQQNNKDYFKKERPGLRHYGLYCRGNDLEHEFEACYESVKTGMPEFLLRRLARLLGELRKVQGACPKNHPNAGFIDEDYYKRVFRVAQENSNIQVNVVRQYVDRAGFVDRDIFGNKRETVLSTQGNLADAHWEDYTYGSDAKGWLNYVRRPDYCTDLTLKLREENIKMLLSVFAPEWVSEFEGDLRNFYRAP